MKTKHFPSWVPSVLAAALLVACGGGGSDAPVASDTPDASALGVKRPFSAVVSFGDSLSDVGTYRPHTIVPGSKPPLFLGGKFTTNSATSTIWVENIAASLGVQLTPAEVGFNRDGIPIVLCPAAVQGLGNTCTAYGQGGSRVTDPDGENHADGALTIPVRTQIERHLSRFGNFKDSDLVLVWAGANDLLWEMAQDPLRNPNSFYVQFISIQTRRAKNEISPDAAQALVAQALGQSKANMAAVAQQLAALVRSEIIAKGGSHVVVLNLPDPVVTPEGAGIAAQSQELGSALTALATAFNQSLAQGLAGQPVQQVDIGSFIADVVAHPRAHDIDNASQSACDPLKIAAIIYPKVTSGSSLFCNATSNPAYNTLRTGASATEWFFADGNHPTTGGHHLISDAVTKQLKAAGWLRGVSH
jgi:phospholipase/lecithinase/hemolysin